MVDPKTVKCRTGDPPIRIVYEGEYGEAVAIVPSPDGKHRVALRWDTFPYFKSGEPAWFEVPEWMNEDVLASAARRLADDVEKRKTK
ncbi:MAG TPA: hypothetical protein VF744_16185 [Beijerinckiaceae bacterium]|jgi:hypothetical protein